MIYPTPQQSSINEEDDDTPIIIGPVVGVPLVAAFATAGSKRQISVSADSLLRAKRLLQQQGGDNSNHKKENGGLPKHDDDKSLGMAAPPPLAVGFQTAGSKRTLSVSEQSLQRAKRLMQQEHSPQYHRPRKMGPTAAAVGQNSYAAKSFDDDGAGDTSPKAPPLAMFQTADGSNRRIQVSEESVQRVNRLILSSENTGRASASTARNMPLAAEEKPSIETREGGPQPSTPLSAMFQTAGSKTEIQVSRESMQRVNRLLQEDKHDKGGPPSKKKILPMSMDNERNPAAATTQGIRGFQTAGSKRNLSVSEQSLQRAKRRMQQEHSRQYHHPRKMGPTAVGQNSYAKNSFDDDGTGDTSPKAPPLAMFQTAGSNRRIQVSEESVQRVNRLILNSENTGGASASTARNMPSAAEEKPSIETRQRSPPLSVMFQTAGSKTEIQVSGESMQRVNWLLQEDNPDKGSPSSKKTLPISMYKNAKKSAIATTQGIMEPPPAMFQTAGSKREIQVAKASMQRVKRIFQDSREENDRFSPNEILPAANDYTNDTPVVVNRELTTTVPPATFQTAGLKRDIQISKESMQRVNRIFENSDASKLPAETALPAVTCNVMQGSPIEHQEREDQWLRATFQTAGSNRAIDVAEQSLQRANRVLHEIDGNQALVASLSAATPSHGTESSNAIVEKNQDLPVPASIFETAGSNRDIHVLNDSMLHATRLLQDRNETKIPASNRAADYDSGAGATPLVERRVESKGLPLVTSFKTAGSKRDIYVSKQGMDNAKRLFHSKNKHEIHRASMPETSMQENGMDVAPLETQVECKVQPPLSTMFQTAGSNQEIQVSNSSMHRANQLPLRDGAPKTPSSNPPAASTPDNRAMSLVKYRQECVGQPRLALFQTPASNREVDLIPGSMQSANMMTSTTSMASAPPDTSPPENLPLKCSELFASFQTAGSNQEIYVAKESMQHAQQLLTEKDKEATGLARREEVLFQAAGSKRGIQVSKESMYGVKQLLEDRGDMRLAPWKLLAALSDNVAGMAPVEHCNGNTDQSRLQPGYQTTTSRGEIYVNRENMQQVDGLLGAFHNRAVIASEERRAESIEWPIESRKAQSTQDLHCSRESSQRAAFLPSPSDHPDTYGREGSHMKPNSSIVGKLADISEPLYSLPTDENISSEDNQVAASPDDTSKVGCDMAHEKSTERQKPSHSRDEFVREAIGQTEWSIDSRTAEAIDNMLSAPVTPLPNVSTPHDQSVRWGSIRKVIYGVTPGPTKTTECPDSYSSTMTPAAASPFQVASSSAIMSDIGRTPQLTIVREAAAKVTLSGDRRAPHQRADYASDRNKNITPVPINFVGSDCYNYNSSSYLRSDSPLDPCRSDLTDESVCNRTFKDAFNNGDFISDSEVCIGHGVQHSTLKVNSLNGPSLRFNSITGLPQGFTEPDDTRLESTIGSSNDVRTALIKQGCDSNLISEKWVSNHLRWIVWKQAAYERRFAPYLGGKYLKFDRIIETLKARYDKEIVQGKRPAVRKILNRDVAASRTMILLVSHFFPEVTSNEGDRNLANLRIEVSDGWYSVPAVLDTALSWFVRNGVLKIGSKVAISSARLIGADDGIDPLDDAYSPTDPSCTIALQLSANATRLAKWNAKLGFVRNSPSTTPKGLLLTKRISDIVPNGGNIPIIRFVIMRRYPLLYYEKASNSEGRVGSTSAGRSSVLTEREEDQRRMEYEKRFGKAVEKLSEELEADITEVS
jgi:hypothetical protein